MKKLGLLSIAVVTLLSSCVSHKKFDALKQKKEDLESQVYKLNAKLDNCLDSKKSLSDQIDYLQDTNTGLITSQGDFAMLSKKAAQNLERSLESIKEKDEQLRTLRDAVNKRDSVNLALVTSLKGVLGDIHDEDIQINVEKGVVFVSISDKLLFSSGSYKVTPEAKSVLGKVAKVVNDKPDFEFMVEGHTDNDAVINGSSLVDNWDLSVKRATSVVRILQKQYHVDPARMTAAGRSEYVPVASNSTAEGKAKNRRTRIVVLPKLDEFYETVQEGMKKAEELSEEDGTENIEKVKEQLEETGTKSRSIDQ